MSQPLGALQPYQTSANWAYRGAATLGATALTVTVSAIYLYTIANLTACYAAIGAAALALVSAKVLHSHYKTISVLVMECSKKEDTHQKSQQAATATPQKKVAQANDDKGGPSSEQSGKIARLQAESSRYKGAASSFAQQLQTVNETHEAAMTAIAEQIGVIYSQMFEGLEKPTGSPQEMLTAFPAALTKLYSTAGEVSNDDTPVVIRHPDEEPVGSPKVLAKALTTDDNGSDYDSAKGSRKPPLSEIGNASDEEQEVRNGNSSPKAAGAETGSGSSSPAAPSSPRATPTTVPLESPKTPAPQPTTPNPSPAPIGSGRDKGNGRSPAGYANDNNYGSPARSKGKGRRGKQ